MRPFIACSSMRERTGLIYNPALSVSMADECGNEIYNKYRHVETTGISMVDTGTIGVGDTVYFHYGMNIGRYRDSYLGRLGIWCDQERIFGVRRANGALIGLNGRVFVDPVSMRVISSGGLYSEGTVVDIVPLGRFEQFVDGRWVYCCDELDVFRANNAILDGFCISKLVVDSLDGRFSTYGTYSGSGLIAMSPSESQYWSKQVELYKLSQLADSKGRIIRDNAYGAAGRMQIDTDGYKTNWVEITEIGDNEYGLSVGSIVTTDRKGYNNYELQNGYAIHRLVGIDAVYTS